MSHCTDQTSRERFNKLTPINYRATKLKKVAKSRGPGNSRKDAMTPHKEVQIKLSLRRVKLVLVFSMHCKHEGFPLVDEPAW